MKVYDGKTLIASILFGGAGTVYSINRIVKEDYVFGSCCLILFILYLIKGLRIALIEKEYNEEQVNVKKSKKIRRKLFGKFAPVMPYGALICFVLAAVFAWLLPEKVWIVICFVIAAPIYQLWLAGIIRREMDKD